MTIQQYAIYGEICRVINKVMRFYHEKKKDPLHRRSALLNLIREILNHHVIYDEASIQKVPVPRQQYKILV